MEWEGMGKYKFRVVVKDGEEPALVKKSAPVFEQPIVSDTFPNRFFQEWKSRVNQPSIETIYILNEEGNPIRVFEKTYK